MAINTVTSEKIYRPYIRTLQKQIYYTITARLWYNRPIRRKQISDLRICEDNRNKRIITVYGYYIITARLWYNRPIRRKQISDLRICEDN